MFTEPIIQIIIPDELPAWLHEFSELERKEIMFCLTYAHGFNHGASDHNRMRVIAKFASLLQAHYHKHTDEAAT